MTYASEDLVNEHEGILFGLKILEKMAGLLNSSKKVFFDDLKEMVNFLKLFADKCHHGKEEGLLFPEMEKAGIPNENGPIGQMLLEHAEGRKYVAQMAESLEKEFRPDAFVTPALHYITLLRNHIAKENNVLFPLGDSKIPMDVQKRLLSAFEEHEEKVMGTGTHEKLHEILHKFEEKYLEVK
jgi:hemerythrin-like domain-containing protein